MMIRNHHLHVSLIDRSRTGFYKRVQLRILIDKMLYFVSEFLNFGDDAYRIHYTIVFFSVFSAEDDSSGTDIKTTTRGDPIDHCTNKLCVIYSFFPCLLMYYVVCLNGESFSFFF